MTTHKKRWRKAIIVGLGLTLTLVSYFPVEAQRHPARITILDASEEPRFAELLGGLRRGLRDLGYSENTFEIIRSRVDRSKERDIERVVLNDIVPKNTDVLFAIGSRFVKRVHRVAPQLPIVFITPGDPVASGIVASLSRPGDNTTGLTFNRPELSGKRLEILKEITPDVDRVLAFCDPDDPSPPQSLAVAEKIAQRLGIKLLKREVRTEQELMSALSALGEAQAFLGIPGGFPTGHHRIIIGEANSKRLPTIVHAHNGSTMEALASYGVSDAVIARHAARYIDKILKGANAGKLPVERPMASELTINLKTAKQIGLTIPPNVLARADKVIK